MSTASSLSFTVNITTTAVAQVTFANLKVVSDQQTLNIAAPAQGAVYSLKASPGTNVTFYMDLTNPSTTTNINVTYSVGVTNGTIVSPFGFPVIVPVPAASTLTSVQLATVKVASTAGTTTSVTFNFAVAPISATAVAAAAGVTIDLNQVLSLVLAMVLVILVSRMILRTIQKRA
jgi:hypothetical protein